MSTSAAETTGAPPREPARGAPRDEIDAACRRLGAARADVERLLARIDRHAISPTQRPGLLDRAHERLQGVRANLPGLADLTARIPGVDPDIEAAGRALRTDGPLSLDEACRAFGAAGERLDALASDDAHRARARLLACRAQLAAALQAYREAAGHYAEAAASPGLPAAEAWRYPFERARVLVDLGRDYGDDAALEEAAALCDETLPSLATRDARPGEWAAGRHLLGHALGLLGQRQRGTRLLERAIEAFETALAVRDRERDPLGWAETQNDLGNALGALALRRNDSEMLERSVEAFERALEARTRERAPRAWAATQNNLGAVLQALGQREKETKRLKAAVDAHTNALREWTRDAHPLDWAAAFNNLGTALRLLGEHRRGPRTLERAVAAFHNALAERTRERMPQEWAATQNNLGAALLTLGQRQDDTTCLIDAVAAFESALEVWTRERTPMGWAMTTANLGVARRELAARASDAEVARRAVEDLRAAVALFRHASHAQYTELGEEQLAKARDVLARLRPTR